MNREETRKAAEVMMHYANGGEVQMQNENGCMWHEYAIGCDPSWNWEHKTYRIKRKPIEVTKWVWVINSEVHACLNEKVAKGHAERSGGHAVELKGTYTCDT